MKTGLVICDQNGLTVTIPPSWIVAGEDRLSYTTLIQLVECCREYQWQKDILSKIERRDIHLDSICKSLTCDFIAPILVGSTISISYCTIEVRRKGYSLRFEVRNTKNKRLRAMFKQVSVFYDPVARRSIAPPYCVLEYLSTYICEEVQE